MDEQRAMQNQQHHQAPIFLEQWLLHQTGTTSSPSPPPIPPSATSTILQSWSQLRQNPNNPLPHLHTLLSYSTSLHVADPQAKLLLSLLSPSSPPPPPLLHLLYIWTRKTSRPSPSLLQSALHLLNSAPTPQHLLLLLGSISAVPGLPQPSRASCLAKIASLLEEGTGGITEISPEVLAGIGYSLSRCGSVDFVRKIVPLVLDGRGFRESVEEGLIVMGLAEWVVGEWVKFKSLDEIQAFCEVITSGGGAKFVVGMCCAGVLRAVWGGGVGFGGRFRDSLERALVGVAKSVVCRVVEGGYELDAPYEDPEMRLVVRCIVLGLARCGPVKFHGDLMMCVCLGLLNEVLPLRLFGGGVRKSVDAVEVKEHLDSVLFREAGAVSGVLCNQYAMADEENRGIVENYLWSYCHRFYSRFRVAFWELRKRNEELLRELDKMAESVFLMVVVFASQVSKLKLDPKCSISVRSDASVRILIGFSCIEYLRRVRWPEYSDVVRRAVLSLQEDINASASFVESMPSYNELTNKDGSSVLEGNNYAWSEDEIQTARLLFYLRVVPTCMVNLPAPTFTSKVAPTMFLYMGHPNEKVSRASHSVFVSFMSSVPKESDRDDLTELKEKLVFYYMERSLQGFPAITSYEGMASGVVALVRHLPAGSPAMFYCTGCLVEKAIDMFDSAVRQDSDLWINWESDPDPCKKILGLLLHLVTFVDIQVLPNLLRSLAQFVVKLPKAGQEHVLNDMYATVADSDDVIRKPTLVSWLQSLSYLSTQVPPSSENPQASDKSGLQGEDKQDASILSLDVNSSHSRL